MSDAIQNWIGNARNAEYGFIKAVVYALEQFKEKNNKPMYALIAFVNGKKFGSYKIEEGYRMTQFSAPLRRVLDKALANVTFTFKGGQAKVKVGANGGVNNDALETLRMLAASNVGVKSDAFKEHFPVVKKASKKKDTKALKEQLDKYVARIAGEMEMTEAQIVALITAKASDIA